MVKERPVLYKNMGITYSGSGKDCIYRGIEIRMQNMRAGIVKIPKGSIYAVGVLVTKAILVPPSKRI